MLRRLGILGILCLFLSLVGCSLLSHEAPSEDVDKAAALFFQRFGNEDYNTIYDDAAKGFRDTQTRQTVTDNLKQIAENGKIVQFERMSMAFKGEGKQRMALPVYSTATDRSRAEITLTFQDESGEWKLFGFAYKPKS